MNRWSFNLQIYFLGQRIRQATEILSTGSDLIQDRTIYEDAHIFATNLHETGLMSTRDFDTYMKIFRSGDRTHAGARSADLPEGERADARVADQEAGESLRNEHTGGIPRAAQPQVRRMDQPNLPGRGDNHRRRPRRFRRRPVVAGRCRGTDRVFEKVGPGNGRRILFPRSVRASDRGTARNAAGSPAARRAGRRPGRQCPVQSLQNDIEACSRACPVEPVRLLSARAALIYARPVAARRSLLRAGGELDVSGGCFRCHSRFRSAFADTRPVRGSRRQDDASFEPCRSREPDRRERAGPRPSDGPVRQRPAVGDRECRRNERQIRPVSLRSGTTST